jgi:hypothetical protein
MKEACILVIGLFFVQLTFEPAHARDDKYLLPVGEFVKPAEL